MNNGADRDDKTQTHVPLTMGTMVGHYRIVEKIGAGGMGEVSGQSDTLLRHACQLSPSTLYLGRTQHSHSGRIGIYA